MAANSRTDEMAENSLSRFERSEGQDCYIDEMSRCAGDFENAYDVMLCLAG